MIWHQKTAEETYSQLAGSPSGLTQAEAHERQQAHGFNELPEAKTSSYVEIFFRQFASPLIYLLLAATVSVLVMGEWADAIFIAVVLVINAVIGTIQEGRAQSALGALKKLSPLQSVVLRDGKEVVIPAREVVPGDLVVLREGDRVPADARVIQADSLRSDESALTGESVPVEKVTDAISGENLPLGDQKNMAWSGTYVAGGSGLAIVVATGLATELGEISSELSGLETDLPLKQQIKKLSRVILVVVLAASALLFIGGVLSGMPVSDMFAIVVAVAVAVTPEGLPVVVTLILAAGVARMSRKNALVKNLQAVEALGQADIIAVDKTGTITLNQMMVSEAYVGGTFYTISGQGYEPTGTLFQNGEEKDTSSVAGFDEFARAGLLTSSASVAYSQTLGLWDRISGDPTEAATAVLGEKFGVPREELLNKYRKVFEEPFSSDLRYHAVAYQHNGARTLYVAGAPETVLERLSDAGGDRSLSYQKTLEEMSSRGLRVIALAKRELGADTSSEPDVKDLELLGLAGIADTIRPSVRGSVELAGRAGIRVVMITGDYAATAQALAEQVGIYKKGDLVITGQDILSWTPAELAEKIPHASVFARVAPDHKMRIVQAYRKAGYVVAMTGDGVNDALPLAAADLGVAMGKVGTEVAKEASDIILLDDDFGSIVLAVEEGRSIYRTIKKVVLYLLSTSLAELFVIIGALALGLPIPFSATQIIWLNFVTDGFLVAAIAAAKKEEGLLDRVWTKSDQDLLDRSLLVRMVVMAAVMTGGTLLVFAFSGASFAVSATMALTAIAAYQWLNAFNASSDRSIFKSRVFENLYLVGSFLLVVVLHLLILYVPFLAKVFDTTPLSLQQLGISIVVALTIIVADEAVKMLWLNKSKKPIQ